MASVNDSHQPKTHSIQKVTVLGATGSIGVNTLDVIERHPDKFEVFALTANRNHQLLLEQIGKFKPKFAVVVSAENTGLLVESIRKVSPATQLLIGEKALSQVASDEQVDTVMAAIVGAAGLKPTLAAATAGKKVLLANKEALVVAGDLFMNAVTASDAVLLPIDSEHNAIFQCLPDNRLSDRAHAGNDNGVAKVLLTGSGGPFLTRSLESLVNVTPAEACAHPNWSMGQKISVDSATMMNKGLEVIEACHLFGLQPHDIQVVIHPQSIIHSMVSYIDGSVIAQMGQPDMRTPIAYGLAWPERIAAGVEPLDFVEVSKLSFNEPDNSRYPCLKLAFDALGAGRSMPAVLNAANEEAVAAFLAGRIGFTQIAEINQQVMLNCESPECDSIDAVLAVDSEARRVANQLIDEV